MTIVPAQAIEVRVVRDDDGKPMAGAWVKVRAERRNPFKWGEIAEARADDQGRIRIIPWAGDLFSIIAYPPEGQPYLPWVKDVNWPKGAVEKSVELKLKRGVVVHGTLTEEPSGGTRGRRRHHLLPEAQEQPQVPLLAAGHQHGEPARRVVHDGPPSRAGSPARPRSQRRLPPRVDQLG